jgi:hypothetical protein
MKYKAIKDGFLTIQQGCIQLKLLKRMVFCLLVTECIPDLRFVKTILIVS